MAPTLHIGIMVHLEGHDLSQDQAYNLYKDQILELAGVFEQHGAKLTLEVKEAIEACEEREDSYFHILEQRGHAIGVHADAGGNPEPGETWEDMALVMREMRSGLERQGVTARHVSGYCSPLDWVEAVVEAGFEFVSGGVAFCLLSLPEEDIPEAFRDCATPTSCHEAYPLDMRQRLHAWTIKRGEPWIEDHPDGELVFLPAAIEGLAYLSEMADSEHEGGMAFDEGDVDVYLEKLEFALANLDPNQPNFFYVPWSFGMAMPTAFAHDWLTAIEPYVASGQVTWNTLPEMVDIFTTWRDSP